MILPENEHFYIYLDGQHATTTRSYNYPLPRALTFGEDEWECALINATFPASFYNMPKCSLHIMADDKLPLDLHFPESNVKNAGELRNLLNDACQTAEVREYLEADEDLIRFYLTENFYTLRMLTLAGRIQYSVSICREVCKKIDLDLATPHLAPFQIFAHAPVNLARGNEKVYILSNFVKNSIVNSAYEPILAAHTVQYAPKITAKATTELIDFSSPFASSYESEHYKTVASGTYTQLSIQMKTETGTLGYPDTHVVQPSFAIHFRKINSF